MQNNNSFTALQLTKTKGGNIRWHSLDVQQRLAHWSAIGLSATEIAEHLQCRRDQVAGAMRRYGLFAACRG